ncbi:SLC13 family permease [Bacteroidota bacterium]
MSKNCILGDFFISGFTGTSNFKENTREYIVEAQVRSNSQLIGKTIIDAGLRNLKGLYLYEIMRGEKRIRAVSHNEVLREDDHLFFAGDIDNIAEMVNSKSGLTLPLVGMLSKKKHTEVVEVVISHNSSLISKTVKEANFRGKYDAAIIAIHRNGERIKGKLGSIEIKAGDVLLILAGEDLANRSKDSQDFYFISKVREFNKLDRLKSTVLISGIVLAVILKAFGLVSLFMIVLGLLLLLTALKIASAKDIYKSFDYNLAIIIAMALAFGTAMTKSGVAEMAAQGVISVFKPLGNMSLLFGIFIITSLLAAFITNAAAVAIVFPISLTMALQLDLNPMPFILIVAYAAAANFMTPIGYQTNLMVYGPGGYSFKDFFKVGFPLTLIYMVGTILILHLIYF